MTGLLQREIDRTEFSQSIGLECDSDQDMDDDSDDEYHSADEAPTQKKMKYTDIDTMFDIVNKRYLHKWSMSTLHSRYKLIPDNESGRKEIWR